MTADSQQLLLYPKIEYRKGLLDLFLRHKRLRYPTFGRLTLGPGAHLRLKTATDSVVIDLADGFSMLVSVLPTPPACEVSLRIRPVGTDGRVTQDIAVRAMLPAEALAQVKAEAHGTRYPFLTGSGFAALWTWLQPIAAASNLTWPDLTLPASDALELETQRDMAVCIACNSFNVLGGTGGWRCVDCGYESSERVEAKRLAELEAKIAGMDDAARDTRSRELLVDVQLILRATVPDVGPIVRGGNDTHPLVQMKADSAVKSLWRARMDAELAQRYAVELRPICDEVMASLDFVPAVDIYTLSKAPVEMALAQLESTLETLQRPSLRDIMRAKRAGTRRDS